MTAPESTVAPAAVGAVARDTVANTVHAVSAGLLTGDPRTVSDTSAWLFELLCCRGVDATAAMADLRQELLSALIDYPLSVELVRRHFFAASAA
jgi:hypothetical protein